MEHCIPKFKRKDLTIIIPPNNMPEIVKLPPENKTSFILIKKHKKFKYLFKPYII
jgi:hypothetical protein